MKVFVDLMMTSLLGNSISADYSASSPMNLLLAVQIFGTIQSQETQLVTLLRTATRVVL